MRKTFLLLAPLVLSCSKPSSRPSGVDAGGFDVGALLEATGVCVAATYDDFTASASKLDAATTALAAKPDDAALHTAARDAWLAAMDAWQVVELGQIGPLAPTSQPGGKGLRDGFYAWPLLGRCLADEATAARSYEAVDFASKSLPSARGLGTLEYLLYVDLAEHGCGSSSPAASVWPTLGEAEIRARRASYASVLAKDLLKNAQALTAGNTALVASLAKVDQKAALDAILGAVFYVDFMTKDVKLGVPSGYIVDPACGEPPCGELVEARWSKTSKRHVRTNLVAFGKVWNACGAKSSFDAYLRAAGGASLADEIAESLTAAIAAVDAFPFASIEEGLAKDPAAVKTLILAIKNLTDALKTDVVSVLHLDLPARVAGDND